MDEQTKRRFIWPVIGLSCLPLVFIISLPKQFSVSSVLLYLSALAGYVGVIFLLWMYILGAKSAMSVIFKDIAPVLSIHKSLGKWGSIAFLLHPIFVGISYFEASIKSLTYIVLPDISSAMESRVTLGRIAFYIIIVVWLTSKFFRNKLGFRAWKYLHYFAYISLPFALLHVPDLGSQYLGHEAVRAYYIAIAGLLGVFSLLRIGGWLNLDRKAYTVVSQTHIADDDYVFVLRSSRPKWLQPKAGQYVYIKQGIISEDHPFSVTYYDKATGELTVVYRVFGGYTKYLAKLHSSARVSIMGPFGAFTADLSCDDHRPVVYIAGGVGITPFVQRIIDEGDRRPQLLFAANRTHASAVLVPTLKQVLGNRLVAIYSREEPANETEERGHISEEILRKHIAAPLEYRYYICGPRPFVRECRRILELMNIPLTQISEEKFSW